LEQCRQLTKARAEYTWLAAGSQMVQQQALRDFAQAMVAFFDPGNPTGRPTWRKAGRDEGFRIVGKRGRQWDVRRVSRRVGEVRVPKAGWVRFRLSRPVPPGVKSYRLTRDRAGRWHVAFAAIPSPVPAPGNGQVVGVDRGVAVSAALSTGELLRVPGLTAPERARLRRLERKLARARRGSGRRKRVKAALTRLRARETDRRRDWAVNSSPNLPTWPGTGTNRLDTAYGGGWCGAASRRRQSGGRAISRTSSTVITPSRRRWSSTTGIVIRL
jgi:transposase